MVQTHCYMDANCCTEQIVFSETNDQKLSKRLLCGEVPPNASSKPSRRRRVVFALVFNATSKFGFPMNITQAIQCHVFVKNLCAENFFT